MEYNVFPKKRPFQPVVNHKERPTTSTNPTFPERYHIITTCTVAMIANNDNVETLSSHCHSRQRMPTTKQVVVLVALLAIAVLHSNLQVVLELSLFEPPAAPSQLVRASNVPDSSSHNKTSMLGPRQDNPNKLIHVAIFGLGHRLIRTTAAWHLAQRIGLKRFKFQWGTCGKDNSTELIIFPYLFGHDEWNIPTLQLNTLAAKPLQYGRNVLVRNDVYGYLPAQTFQDHRIPLDEKIYKHSLGPFHSKLDSDIRFYQQLQSRFVFRKHLDQFMLDHGFHEHRVIGIHLRAGNGEEEHFTYAGRHIANETIFISNLVELIKRFLILDDSQEKAKPPLIFLATDTPYLVPTMANLTLHFGVSTVVFPQIRVADHQGVTFSAFSGTGRKCLLGWQAMMADMILLSETDLLIAARHSSFTQSMPISLLFHRKENEDGPHFCEVSTNATTMSCFQDLSAWLYRDEPKKEWTYSLPSASTGERGQVHHKSLVHLPDKNLPKEYDDVLKFLAENEIPKKNEGSSTHRYGSKRFYPKYRHRKPSPLPGWNFTSDAHSP